MANSSPQRSAKKANYKTGLEISLACFGATLFFQKAHSIKGVSQEMVFPREVVMIDPSKPPRHWRVVAEEVTREQDRQKMTELAQELLDALDQAKGANGRRSGEKQTPRDFTKTA